MIGLVEPLTRDAAQQAARRELTRREYSDARPPLLLRLIGRALRALGDLLQGAANRVGDGPLARVLLLALLAGLVAVVLVRLGPARRQAKAGAVLGAGPAQTAAQHRAAADLLARQGRWAEAVRERLRAVVRELEARGVLDARPGRTAGEVAVEAGRAVPALAGGLSRAAALFDAVWYGGRPASAQTYAALVTVDEQVAAARRDPVQSAAAQSGPAQSGPARSGPAHSGPAHSGPAHSGAAQSGPAHSGPALSEPAHPGPAPAPR